MGQKNRRRLGNLSLRPKKPPHGEHSSKCTSLLSPQLSPSESRTHLFYELHLTNIATVP